MIWAKMLLSSLIVCRYVTGEGGIGEDGSLDTIRDRRARSAERENCFWNLTVGGSGGTLTSPNYPNNYPNNADCRWLLTSSDSNASVYLRIDSLRLEKDQDCKSDFLRIHAGPSPLSPAVATLCGSKKDALIKTNSSVLLLVFQSDPVYEDKGFAIDYFPHTPGDCQALVTGDSGSLKSPGFPDNYPDSTDCWTEIEAGPGKRILLRFNSLDLEYGENCTFDYVQVFDGRSRNSTLLGQVCRGETSFESTSSTLLVHFHSDNSVSRRGYRATYTAVDKKTVAVGDCLWEERDGEGTILSPNYPSKYPSFANCSVWLEAPPGHRVLLLFESLQLEIETNCSYDFLQVVEETQDGEKVLARLCGRGKEPKNLTSSSEKVVVRFQSDDFAEFSGFKIKYLFIRNDTEPKQEAVDQQGSHTELSFIEQPKDISLPEGASFLLQCSTADPTAKIRWLKDDVFMGGSNPLPKLSLLSNNSLWIESMAGHLAGMYTCVAVSPEESIRASARVTLTNGDSDDAACIIAFRKTPQNSSFAEGEFAHLECLAAGVDVPLAWEKDGRPLVPAAHVTVLRNGYVFLDRIQLSDAGLYSCVARDDTAGCSKKASALVQVTRRMDTQQVCGRPKMGQPSNDVPHEEHGKIVGGHDAKKGAYPWQVMLWEPALQTFCGAALLNERWIATAAHCFRNLKKLNWDRVVIKIGKHDRLQKESTEFQTVIADVSSIVVHPAYDKKTFDNDLALVRLRDHVRFTDYILPICLGDRDMGEELLLTGADQPLKMGSVTGWGVLKENGPSPRFLQEIKMPVVEETACRASTNHTVTRNMFCAGYAQALVGDACYGDSGGPFQMRHEGKWYLTGIVSWGEGCGLPNKYGFYTRIPNYLSWIKGIIRS